METLTEPITEERILIFENTQESSRLRTERQVRSSMLNSITKHNLSLEEVKSISSSKGSIEQFIETRLQAENPEYKKMVKAGISVTARLSNQLQDLKDALVRWQTFTVASRDGDKYDGLILDGKTWQVDHDKLERHFVERRIKFYITGKQLEEYRTLEFICDYLNQNGALYGEMSSANFIAKRFMSGVINNKYQVVIRPQYFMNHD